MSRRGRRWLRGRVVGAVGTAGPVGRSGGIVPVMASMQCLQVTTTLADRGTAGELAAAVVAERLVACAQVVGPIDSVFRWDGEVQAEAEWYCVMKTTAQRFPLLAAWIDAHHPYDTPELVATEIVAGAPDYLAWIASETAPAVEGGRAVTD